MQQVSGWDEDNQTTAEIQQIRNRLCNRLNWRNNSTSPFLPWEWNVTLETCLQQLFPAVEMSIQHRPQVIYNTQRELAATGHTSAESFLLMNNCINHPNWTYFMVITVITSLFRSSAPQKSEMKCMHCTFSLQYVFMLRHEFLIPLVSYMCILCLIVPMFKCLNFAATLWYLLSKYSNSHLLICLSSCLFMQKDTEAVDVFIGDNICLIVSIIYWSPVATQVRITSFVINESRSDVDM